MHFLLQLSLKEKALKEYLEALHIIGANYSFFGHIKETNELSGFPRTQVYFYSIAGISVLKSSRKENITFLDFNGDEIIDKTLVKRFYNSFFYSSPPAFDQKTAIDAGMPLLNKEASFIDLTKYADISFKKDMFIAFPRKTQHF
jgi:hypothetical protein